MNNDQQPKADVYTIVTNRIIEQLEQKIVPWRKPWTDQGIPRNLITKNAYRGINTWLLASAGFEKNFFLTWKQVQDLGATVKRGEKSELVVFWKAPKEQTNDDDPSADETSQSSSSSSGQKKRTAAVLRYYSVFNIAQCEGIPEGLVPSPIEVPLEPIKACDELIKAIPSVPVIQHKDIDAWYDVTTDILNMPKKKSFIDGPSYYSVLMHELVHSTGHPSRLNRKELVEKKAFGTKTYSLEELCAEVGACYLKSLTGIGDKYFEQSVSYIDGWLSQLKKDKRFLFIASANAQRAVDFILNKKPNEREPEAETETGTPFTETA